MNNEKTKHRNIKYLYIDYQGTRYKNAQIN
jgi:hypothetical protein